MYVLFYLLSELFLNNSEFQNWIDCFSVHELSWSGCRVGMTGSWIYWIPIQIIEGLLSCLLWPRSLGLQSLFNDISLCDHFSLTTLSPFLSQKMIEFIELYLVSWPIMVEVSKVFRCVYTEIENWEFSCF